MGEYFPMHSNQKTLNLAMIGCGGYAAYVNERLAELPEVCELLAVTTPDPDDPSAQACRAKGIPVYNSAAEPLDNISPETCDAVLIPTSIDSHYEHACKVVKHGFHVLPEKPPVATIQGLDRLIDLQRESGKFIAASAQQPFKVGGTHTLRLQADHGKGIYAITLSDSATQKIPLERSKVEVAPSFTSGMAGFYGGTGSSLFRFDDFEFKAGE